MTAAQILALPPDKIGKLGSAHTPALASAGISLDRSIAEWKQTLDAIKDRLVAEAQKDFIKEHESDPSEMSDIAGTSWTFQADSGEGAAQVSFPKDGLLKGGFYLVDDVAFKTVDKKPVEIPNLKKLAGKAFERLFKCVWKPTKGFDDIAPALIPETHEKLTELLKEPGSPRVSFKTKE